MSRVGEDREKRAKEAGERRTEKERETDRERMKREIHVIEMF